MAFRFICGFEIEIFLTWLRFVTDLQELIAFEIDRLVSHEDQIWFSCRMNSSLCERTKRKHLARHADINTVNTELIWITDFDRGNHVSNRSYETSWTANKGHLDGVVDHIGLFENLLRISEHFRSSFESLPKQEIVLIIIERLDLMMGSWQQNLTVQWVRLQMLCFSAKVLLPAFKHR